MKRALSVLCCLIFLLGACAPERHTEAVATIPTPQREAPSGQADLSEEDAAFEEAVREIGAKMERCTPQEALEAYLELQYLGYIYLKPVDMGMVLDIYQHNLHNLDVWQEHLTQRRRLIGELGLAYVETERFPYTVSYLAPEQVSDGRLDYWNGHEFKDGAEEVLHFTVTGEPGKAYPPLLCIGGQQTARLRREGDSWRVTFLYFPGAVRKFYNKDYMDIRPDEEVKAELLAEFTAAEAHGAPPAVPGRPYVGEHAAGYARMFAESPNPAFYSIGDWKGNCMNFVSQCVAHGFSGGKIPTPAPAYFDLMAPDWYAGDGGGVHAWENVNYFWSFATGDGPMWGTILDGSPSGWLPGDVVQTRSSFLMENDDPNDFDHSLLVVDSEKLILAQNSPANFVYYADLVNTDARVFRPVSLEE